MASQQQQPARKRRLITKHVDGKTMIVGWTTLPMPEKPLYRLLAERDARRALKEALN